MRRRPRPAGEGGQITLLAIAYALIGFSLVAVVVDATAVHLARSQLSDAADAAALDAADALAPSVYTAGVRGAAVPLSDGSVREQATTYLAGYSPPPRLEQVTLAAGTGSPDGQSATVALSARVRLPIAAAVLRSFRDGLTVSVTSTARAPLR